MSIFWLGYLSMRIICPRLDDICVLLYTFLI